jgi:hypothetical protein
VDPKSRRRTPSNSFDSFVSGLTSDDLEVTDGHEDVIHLRPHGGARRDDTNDFFVEFLIKSMNDHRIEPGPMAPTVI